MTTERVHDVRVERVTEPTADVVEALSRLLPQLAPREPPTPRQLREIVEHETLLAARDDHRAIVGTLTLVLYRIPTGLRARIEDRRG